jgi:hypothetical protein
MDLRKRFQQWLFILSYIINIMRYLGFLSVSKIYPVQKNRVLRIITVKIFLGFFYVRVTIQYIKCTPLCGFVLSLEYCFLRFLNRCSKILFNTILFSTHWSILIFIQHFTCNPLFSSTCYYPTHLSLFGFIALIIDVLYYVTSKFETSPRAVI